MRMNLVSHFNTAEHCVIIFETFQMIHLLCLAISLPYLCLPQATSGQVNVEALKQRHAPVRQWVRPRILTDDEVTKLLRDLKHVDVVREQAKFNHNITSNSPRNVIVKPSIETLMQVLIIRCIFFKLQSKSSDQTRSCGWWWVVKRHFRVPL